MLKTRWVILLAVVFGFGACNPLSASVESCRNTIFEGDRFTKCTFDPAQQTTRLAWKSPDGVAFRSFSSLAKSSEASRTAFAMNAGMFDDQGTPIGLYVENGHEIRAINLAGGSGNFYLQPNGVFWVDRAGRANVSETAAYLSANPSPVFASQSGPMLVIEGKLHPSFTSDGQSRYIRNGVGADCQGSVEFVITETEVSFGKLARFFRDELKCRNALYFDGAVSSFWAPSSARMDARAPLGPLLIVQTR